MVALLGLLWALASGPGAAQGLDLGIPTAPPWRDPAKSQASAAARLVAQRQRHPLEERFWENIEEDLESVERWRMGLLDVLRFTRKHPQVFPPKARKSDFLFKEFEVTARELWIEAMDYWLALEAVVSRYGQFHRLKGKRRRAAFLAAYAGYLAQGRFARAWIKPAANDPNLEKLFDRPIPGLGVPAGSYGLIRKRFAGPGTLREVEAARSYYRRLGGAGALKKILGRRRRSWERMRRRDSKALPRTLRGSGGMSAKAALKVLRERTFSGGFHVQSVARPARAPAAREVPLRPLMPPPLEGEEISVSSQVIHAVDTVRHWLRVEPPAGRRPDALISLAQIRDLRESLAPGDIFLLRRERYLSEIGLAGFWHRAGLYAGSVGERRKFFGAAGIEELLLRAHPKTYQRSYIEKSTTTPVLSVLAADYGGVSLQSLESFAAADFIAVLRPRLKKRDIGEALVRAFDRIGKPYDFKMDFNSAAALTGAELVYRAYRGGGRFRGLRLEPKEVGGRRMLSANALARKFDSEFGTAEAELDWVLFLEADEPKHEARPSTLEAFRRSWNRPKWTLKTRAMKRTMEKDDEK